MKSVEIVPLQYCRRIHTAPKSPRTPRTGQQSRDAPRVWHSSHGRNTTTSQSSRTVYTPRCPDTEERIERYIPKYYDIVKRGADLKSECLELDLEAENEDLKILKEFRKYPVGRKLLKREFAKSSTVAASDDPVGLGTGLSYDMAERYYLVKLFKDPLNVDVLRNYAGWLEDADRSEDAEKMYPSACFAFILAPP